MRPVLSIVMPTYNGEEFVAAALESVREQRRPEIELVIVDDGSSDNTLRIVGQFANDLSIRLLTPERIGNWVAATNIGLRAASGEWVCFLHQDDLWLPERLAHLWPEMESSPATLIVHNAIYVGPDGRTLGRWTCPLIAGMVAPEMFVEHLLVQNFIAIPSPVFRRDAVVQSGGLNEALWFSADWDLWLRLGAMGPVRFLDETLAAFRIHPASQTAARKLAPREWEQQLSVVLEEHMKTWLVTGKRRTAVGRAANASIAVNSALSAASRGESVNFRGTLLRLARLGPLEWRRYLRDSRIQERVSARLKLKRQITPQMIAKPVSSST
jgi:glycosyltransferase involved in cell wall biosynthesis